MVPARAGVFRTASAPTWTPRGGPREGGGVPVLTAGDLLRAAWSPRGRGCSVRGRGREGKRVVVPARAGVFRACRSRSARTGGGPREGGVFRSSPVRAPGRPRGPREGGGVPGAAPRVARRNGWSPRGRGCSALFQLTRAATDVVPARAGVFRYIDRYVMKIRGGPRESGGVPMRPHPCQRQWPPRGPGGSGHRPDLGRRGSVVPARAEWFAMDWSSVLCLTSPPAPSPSAEARPAKAG